MAATLIEGDHQQAVEPLPYRMSVCQAFEFGNGSRAVAGSDLRSQPIFQGTEAQLLDTPDLGLERFLISQVGVGRASPQPLRFAQ